ncbi:hypothetical protein Landi51_08679 [Colletotrichum acutatum]
MNLSSFPEKDNEQQHSHLNLTKSELKHSSSTIFPFYFLLILSEDSLQSFLEPKSNYRNDSNDGIETLRRTPLELLLSPTQPSLLSPKAMADPISVALVGAAATVAVSLITAAAPEIKQNLKGCRTGRLFRKLNKALQFPESMTQLVHLTLFGIICGGLNLNADQIYDRQRRGASLTSFQQVELARAEQIWSTL